jgi:intein-encoded DNA endonuclease-like protein
MTPDLAYVLGVLWGDGNAGIFPRKTGGYYYRVSLVAKDQQFILSFKEAAYLTISTKMNECVIYTRYNGKTYGPYYKIEISSMPFCEWYKNKTLTEIATEIINAGSECIAPFVKGFFDSDGTPYFKLSLNPTKRPTNREIKIAKGSEEKLRHTQNMLNILGIKSHLRIAHKAQPEKRWNTLYVLRIYDQQSQNRFIQQINSTIPHKKDSLTRILAYNTRNSTLSRGR